MEPISRRGAETQRFDPRAAYEDLCRPVNARSMRALRLDVVYEHALGDELVFHDEEGRPVVVTDLVGGYGATLFGHHHPTIVAAAKDAIERHLPFAAQASVRGKAAELAQRIHDVLLERVGAPYAVLLASTGTEAVEMALKHAEMRWRRQIDALRASLERAIEAAARAPLAPEARETLGIHDGADFAAAVRARFEAEVGAAAPVMIALEGGFHGKTLGSLSLTYADAYREPFARLLMPAWFVPVDDPAALERVVALHTLTYLWPVIDRDSSVRLEAREASAVVAMFAEPIQGEGGVRPVSAAFLSRARELADRHGFALVLDEIQCGMGRTGTFLCSEPLGVRADAYLLSKSLGGGMAKISALAVMKDRFEEDFPLAHGSTFAEDDPSAAVALAALSVLLDGASAPMERAARIGERLLRGLRAIAARFPAVVRDVRGRGLMLGIELGDEQPEGAIRALAEQELLGYAIAGHLLHEHRLRVMPCMSAPRVIRVEPSAYLAEVSIERFLRAFERTCAILASGDAHALLRYLVGRERTGAIEDLRSVTVGRHLLPSAGVGMPSRSEATHAIELSPPRAPLEVELADHRAGFVGYFIDAEQMPKWDPSLARFSVEDRERLVRRGYERIGPSHAGSIVVRSTTGASVELRFYGLFVDSRTFYESLRGPKRELLRAQVERAAELAKADGCTVVGFGGLTSVITGNCRDLSIRGIALTTGNSLTVAMCLEAAKAEAAAMGIDLASATAAAVGAAGNIGSVYCLRISDEVGRMVLVGREGQESALDPLARRIYERAYARLFEASDAGEMRDDAPLRRGLSRALFRSPEVRALLDARVAPAGIGARLAAMLSAAPLVSITSDRRALRDASVILGASNAPHALVHPEHLGGGRVLVVDVAVPGDADPSIARLAPRVKVITGGAVDLGALNAHLVPQAPLPNGHLYSCATETIVLALEGRTADYSVGAVRLEQVEEIRALAARHGFSPARGEHASALAPLRAIA